MSLSALEVFRIAKRISDISELGLLLQFDAAEVDAFEKENDKDLAVKKGTRAMLKIWNEKEGSTKDKLVEALRLCDMEELSDAVEEGILLEEHRRFMDQDVTSSSTVSPNPYLLGMGKQSFDDILKIVAKKMVQDSEIDDLGRALGFHAAERHVYIATNHQYQGITNDGTLQMLRDWRKRQTKSTESLALKRALEKSGNIRLADDLFGKGTTQATSVGIWLQGADVGAFTSLASDAVPDEKLNTLATHVPYGKYTDLTNRLGISFTPAGNILTKHGQDSMKAIKECLAIWKDKTGGSKAELEEILCRAELGALVEHIESGGSSRAFYSTDEVSDSIEMPSKTVRIDSSGGEIEIEECGIRVDVPPGALKTPEDITIKPLCNPPQIDMNPSEILPSWGFQCSPGGLKFHEPIHVRLSHCAVFSKHVKIQAVLYMSDSDKDGGVYKRFLLGNDCHVEKDFLHFHIDHFTNIFITLLSTAHEYAASFLFSKRVCAVPFLQAIEPASKYHLKVFICSNNRGVLEVG